MTSVHRPRVDRRAGLIEFAKRGPVSLAAIALSCLLIVAVVTVPITSFGGSTIAQAAVQRAKSFLELMHQRSPGKRLVGHLAKTKHKRMIAHERALPKVRHRPQLAAMPPFPSEIPPALVDLVGSPLPVEMASLESVPVGPFALTPGGPPGFFLPPPGGYILPPGGSVPSSPTTPTSPTPPPVIVTEAVPEPRSWALLLLGFGLIGCSLRTGTKREQTASR